MKHFTKKVVPKKAVKKVIRRAWTEVTCEVTARACVACNGTGISSGAFKDHCVPCQGSGINLYDIVQQIKGER